MYDSWACCLCLYKDIEIFRSGLLRVMETLFFAPSLLLGFSAQKQELQVDFFSQFKGEVLTVEIQSRHIQVREATMAELRGKLSSSGPGRVKIR